MQLNNWKLAKKILHVVEGRSNCKFIVIAYVGLVIDFVISNVYARVDNEIEIVVVVLISHIALLDIIGH